MEKLIELLNKAKPLKKYKEYWYVWNEIYLYTYAEDYWASKSKNITLDVISKQFWFIKWLVENDKIDTDAYKTVYSGDLDKWKTLTMSSGWDEFYQVTEHWVYESLLMLLSISDTPIEDLISYLK